MKIIHKINLLNSGKEDIELETMDDGEIVLRIRVGSFSYSTRVSEKALNEFVKKL